MRVKKANITVIVRSHFVFGDAGHLQSIESKALWTELNWTKSKHEHASGQPACLKDPSKQIKI